MIGEADFTFRQSELKEWKLCRRRTKWNYWDRLAPVVDEVGPASLGTLVHAGLEDYYTRQMTGSHNARYCELKATADPAQEELAAIMLRGYVEWVEQTGADAGLTIVGVEDQVTVRWPSLIHGHTVDVTGKADLIVVDAFGLDRLLDHKTVQNLNDPQPPQDDQRMTYAVLKMIRDGRTYAGASHNKLRKVKRTGSAKPPFYGRDEIHFTERQLNSHMLHMEAILNEMVYTQLLLRSAEPGTADNLEHALLWPNPTRDCSWRCEFRTLCQLRDDGVTWVDFIGSNFTRGDNMFSERAEED